MVADERNTISKRADYKLINLIGIRLKDERGLFMEAVMILCMYALVIATIAMVAYFVIKRAIKDALREWEEEKKK